jgi:flagellin
MAVLGDGAGSSGSTTFDKTFQIGADQGGDNEITITGKDFSDTGSKTQIAADSGTNDILTESKAKDALTAIDDALKDVRNETIKHGAHQNRFSAVISTLQVSIENQTTARSRIMDTDYAAETATMARSQILQQAGMAMLAQANQLPNGVMALMKG